MPYTYEADHVTHIVNWFVNYLGFLVILLIDAVCILIITNRRDKRLERGLL
jgi:hypothetical protein